MEDRKRTMKQIDNESAYDELEQLQVQVDQGYNTDDINKYRDGIHAYTNDIKKDRDMKNDEKARRLGNIRSKISSFDPSQGPAIRINYEAAKPLMNRRIDKLNGIIRSERARETNDERRLVLENIHAKVPNYDNHNRSVLDNIDKKPPMDMRQPLISNYKMPSSKNTDRRDEGRVNKTFDIQMPEIKTSENRRADARTFLPDFGNFKQNTSRAEDMETEERAMANIYAQDFDDLKMLDMLANNDELYKHKLEQYKKLSTSRIESEKVLQQQRLSKIRNYFGRENYEEERKIELEKWMDQEEKKVISMKIQDRLNQPQTPQYLPTPSPQPRPQRHDEDYDPEVGMGFHFDYVANIQRGLCNQIKCAYAVFNSGEMIVGNKHMGPVLITPDPFSVTHEKGKFSMKHAIKLIYPERNTNLIIEIQIPDRTNPNKFKALGWTLLNLFTFEQ